MDYARHVQAHETPQSEPIPGSAQVPNSAGGYAWAVSKWDRLDRFLVLGTEGGTYYVGERQLTRENADAIVACLAEDAARTITRIAEVSEAGRAPRNDPAVFALALAYAEGNAEARRFALAALPRVCRIGTHLFHFVKFIETLRPAGPKGGGKGPGRWGRALRRAVAAWYQADAPRVAYQAVKYVQRDGWSHKDLVILSHPKPLTAAHGALYDWIVNGKRAGECPPIIQAVEALRAATETKEVTRLIREHRLPREAVETASTEWLKRPEVWEALLEEMPLEAMVRNLGVMTARGLIAPMANATAYVLSRLANADAIRKARLHPIKLLAALLTYQNGSSRGGREWTPVGPIVDALDSAFYLAFPNVETTGKRWLYALDISGSMATGEVAGVKGLTPRIASAAMALVLAATEPQHCFVAFQTELTPLTISPSWRLDTACEKISRLPMGGTDCALPMLYAAKHEIPIDCFVVLTDSETWAGSIHPVQALRKYRAVLVPTAKLIVVGMTASGFTIADPADAGMLDVVGFDTATPELMTQFAR